MLDEAEGGIDRSLLFESDLERLLFSEEVDICNFKPTGLFPNCSMGCPIVPMGVAMDNFGAASRDARLNLGISFCSASEPTGRWLGDGGIARPSLRPGPPRPRPPGCGGLNRGTGEAMLGMFELINVFIFDRPAAASVLSRGYQFLKLPSSIQSNREYYIVLHYCGECSRFV